MWTSISMQITFSVFQVENGYVFWDVREEIETVQKVASYMKENGIDLLWTDLFTDEQKALDFIWINQFDEKIQIPVGSFAHGHPNFKIGYGLLFSVSGYLYSVSLDDHYFVLCYR